MNNHIEEALSNIKPYIGENNYDALFIYIWRLERLIAGKQNHVTRPDVTGIMLFVPDILSHIRNDLETTIMTLEEEAGFTELLGGVWVSDEDTQELKPRHDSEVD